MFNCFSIECFEEIKEEEIKELVKKEVTLKGLLGGKPEHTAFKILQAKKEIQGKNIVFVFVFEEDEPITAKNEQELFEEGFLFLEEENKMLQISNS